MQVHIETLKHAGEDVVKGKDRTYTFQRYTVEVTIGNDRRAIRCTPCGHERLDLYGLAVRFSTGTKVWPGTATYWYKGGHVNNLRPNIDKRGYFLLVGYAADFDGKAVRSQHNAVA